MSDEKAVTVKGSSELDPVSEQPQSITDFALAMQALSEAAKKRRVKKTPRQLRKPRVVGKNDDGSDRVVDTVDRPEFQKWWDDNFPGWSVPICNYSTMMGPEGKPAMFNCDLIVVVRDIGNVIRHIPGTGSASVSVKEVERSSAQLLVNKRTIAKTNAMKDAAGWLGAFFDLRADEEARERTMMPPEPHQQEKFKNLIAEIPEAFRGNIERNWALQNIDTAQKYLDDMEKALKKRNEDKQKASPQPTTGV